MARAWKPWTKRTAWIVGVLMGLPALLFIGLTCLDIESQHPGILLGKRYPVSYWKFENKSSFPIWLIEATFNGTETLPINRMIYGKNPPKLDGVTRRSIIAETFANTDAPVVTVSMRYRIGYHLYIENFSVPNVSYSCSIVFILTDKEMETSRCRNLSLRYDYDD